MPYVSITVYLQGQSLPQSLTSEAGNDFLEQLPREALEIVLSFLNRQTLVQLHAATATRMSAVQQRLTATRCACHWLNLSRRVPPLRGGQALAAHTATYREWPAFWEHSEVTESEVSESGSIGSHVPSNSSYLVRTRSSAAISAGTDIEALTSSSGSDESIAESSDETESPLYAVADLAKQIRWRPCSKHSLLGTLHGQIQHINDVAALMFDWTASSHFDWNFELSDLGLSYQDFLMDVLRCSMGGLKAAIEQAFVLGWDGYVNFYRKKDDTSNKWQDFLAFINSPNVRDVQYSLEFHDQLAFMCVLYRLQQLPPQAVLARMHGILSRCCRWELLLLSQLLERRARYQEGDGEEPESDVLSAFGQNCFAIKPVVSVLTYEQRCTMLSCVKAMVHSFVARSK